MKKIDLLDFLNFEDSVTAKAVAERFDISLGAIYNTLTVLNIQGLVRKMRDDGGVLTFVITEKGKERLDYLNEKEDDNSFDENLEVKINTGGGTKMKVVLNLDREVYDAIGEWASDNRQYTIPEAIEEIVTSFLDDEGFLELEDESEEE